MHWLLLGACWSCIGSSTAATSLPYVCGLRQSHCRLSMKAPTSLSVSLVQPAPLHTEPSSLFAAGIAADAMQLSLHSDKSTVAIW